MSGGALNQHLNIVRFLCNALYSAMYFKFTSNFKIVAVTSKTVFLGYLSTLLILYEDRGSKMGVDCKALPIFSILSTQEVRGLDQSGVLVHKGSTCQLYGGHLTHTEMALNKLSPVFKCNFKKWILTLGVNTGVSCRLRTLPLFLLSHTAASYHDTLTLLNITHPVL